MFQGPYLPDAICQGDNCPGNICPGGICTYQSFNKLFGPTFWGARIFSTKILLHPNFFKPKVIWTKMEQIYFWPNFLPKIFQPQRFGRPFFWTKNFLELKIFGIQKSFEPKVFRTQNFFTPKMFLDLICFSTHQISLDQIIFGLKILWNKNFYGLYF